MNKTQYDTAELEELVERTTDMIYRLAVVYCKSPSDAEDIVQEVYIKYCKQRPNFESVEHEKAWFIRVTINCCKDFIKSAWNQKTTALEDTMVSPELESNDLLQYIMNLPKRYKLVVYLHYYMGDSIEEIGALISKNPNTLRTWLFRARKMLKKVLEEEDETWIKKSN